MEDPMILQVFTHHLETNLNYPNVTDLKHIYQTTLTPFDLTNNTFAIPSNDVVIPFLTQTEELYLQWKTADGCNTKIPLNVVVGFTSYKLSLSRLNNYSEDSCKQSNTSNESNNSNESNISNESNNKRKGKEKVNEEKEKEWVYVVNSEWNRVKMDNHMQSGDLIQVMSFRSHDHEIGFIISRTPRDLILHP